MADLHIWVRGADRAVALPKEGAVTVGRAPECDVALDDHAVSRRHCRFAARGDEVVVSDLGSANGTFVNGTAVATAVVGAGDVVRVGGTELELVDGDRPRTYTRFDAAVVDAGAQDVEAVISKRFEPSRFGWLTDATAALMPPSELLQRAERHLATLHDVSERLAAARDVQGVADATLRAILDVTTADRAAIVRGPAGADGAFEVAAARARVATDEQLAVSRTLVTDVIEKGVSIFARDAAADPRFSKRASVITQHVRSVMAVPLRTADGILGALYADSRSGAGRFTEADLELLAAIGNQAGVALHRVRLLGELERLLIDAIRAIVATIDAKDGYTHRHSERVAALSKHLAAAIGLSAADQDTAHLSALLHDVGKIAVPDSILNKPGRLTPQETADMQRHPAQGARILENIQSEAIRAVLPGVRHHHEKWDGSGYPDGLSGEAIPLLGRIVGLADFIDALTSARAYRAAMPIDDVVALIRASAGTHFDPAIAAAIERMHAEGDLLPDGWAG